MLMLKSVLDGIEYFNRCNNYNIFYPIKSSRKDIFGEDLNKQNKLKRPSVGGS